MNEVAKLKSASNGLLHGSAAVPELFVINLCASMTPMPAVPRNLKGFEKYKLYQVSRQEDGRRRYRLRLGFFTSEADAEWVLNSVRNLYPTAFTGCVTQEDLRYFGEPTPAASVVAPKAAAPAPIATQKPLPPAARDIKQPVAVTAPAATQAVTAKPPAKPSAPAATAPKLNLTLEAPPAIASKPDQRAATEPFHVARGVQIPETNLELTDEYAALPAPVVKAVPAVARPAAPAPAKSAAIVNHSAAPLPGATLINPPKIVDDYVPILDTTLTIRTLTSAEADDPNRPKWFAVQLALSEQPINLDTMPKLDIFAAYTLYSVAMMEGGTIKHALRLGFFRENVSAEAVMGYLKAFFNMPAITQIATAEYERFAESKPKLQSSAATDAKVVKLDGKRPAAPVKPVAPVATPKPASASRSATVAKPKEIKRVAPPPRPQSFLSRLIGRQLD